MNKYTVGYIVMGIVAALFFRFVIEGEPVELYTLALMALLWPLSLPMMLFAWALPLISIKI